MLHRLEGGGFGLRLEAGSVRPSADPRDRKAVAQNLSLAVPPLADFALRQTLHGRTTPRAALFNWQGHRRPRRRSRPPKCVGFPDPLSGTLKKNLPYLPRAISRPAVDLRTQLQKSRQFRRA